MSDAPRERPFIILRHDGVERRIDLASSFLVIGRAAECDVRIDEETVSKNHCHIVVSSDAWTLTDLGSSNGTFLNGSRIKQASLHRGDAIRVGPAEILFFPTEAVKSSAMQPSAKGWGYWIFSARPVLRCIQFVLTTALFGSFALYQDSDLDGREVAQWWGGRWSAWWNAIFTPIRRPDDLPPPRHSQEKHVAVANPTDPLPADEPPPEDVDRYGDRFQELADRAFQALMEDVESGLAKNDYEGARRAVEAFRKGPFGARRIAEVLALERKLSDAIAAIREEERKREAAMQALFNNVLQKVTSLMKEERFDEAMEELQPLLSYETLKDRAEKAMADVRKAREGHIATTLPERRRLFGELALELRPRTSALDFDSALRRLKELERDPRFPSHTPLLRGETGRLEEAKALTQTIADAIRKIPEGTKLTIPLRDGREATGKFQRMEGASGTAILWIGYGNVKERSGNLIPFGGEQGFPLRQIAPGWLIACLSASERSPLVEGNFLLYAESFEKAGEAAIDEILRVGDASPELAEFFERLQMTVEAYRKADAADALAAGDVRAMERARARFGEFEENDLWRRDIDARLARENVAEGPYRGLKPEVAKIARRLEETIAAGGTIDDRARLSRAKVKAIKDLKIVGEGAEMVSFIAWALEDVSSDVRIEACRAIAAIGKPPADVLWMMAKLLDDPLPEVGQAAVDALNALKIDAGLIKQKAKSEVADERRLAAVVAGILDDKTYRGMLESLLKDNAWEVRKAAAVGLAKLGDPASGSAMTGALKKEASDEVQVALAYGLKKLKHKEAVAAIDDVLKEKPHHRYKHDLIKAVGAIGGTESAKVLKSFLRDLDFWTRSYAVEALAQSGTKVVLEDVKHLMVDDAWMVRAGAVKALGAGGDDKSLETIVLMLDDKDAAVRATAMHGLATWKSAKVIPAVIVKLDDLGGEGSALAREVLKILTNRTFATKPEWEQWWRANGGAFRLAPVEQRFENPKK